MAIRLRGWLALGSSVGVVAVACGDDTVAQRTPAKLAQGCTLNSECATPLICAFQRCHTACNESRDCPPGQRCVAGGNNKNVCLLPEEEECVSDAGCQGDQVCAEDQECRDPCTDEDQCIGDQVCSTSGACADPDEVDDEGNLPQSGSGGTGGSAGGGGKGGTGGDAAMGGESGDASGGRTGGTGGSSGNGGDGGQGEGAEGGTGGNGGTAGADAGTGGTAGTVTAGTGGTAGNGTGGAGAGTAGTAGTSGSSGTAGATGAGCIRELLGEYAVRTDSALLYEGTPERRIVDANTALPLTGVVNVLTGLNHGCAARTDGSAWCWPINANGDQFGQLGDGTPVSSVLFGAVRVRTSDTTYLENVTSIASGSFYSLNTSCAVSAGTLWCWGTTSELLNNGTAQQSIHATQVTTNGTTPLTNVKEAAISWGHACALIEAGTNDEVWCWGNNDSAEAGNGATGRVQYPTKVVGLVDPRAVRVTAETSLVTDGDRVKCWGRNFFGECGTTNNTNPQYTPILAKLQAGTVLDGVATLDSANNESCVRRNDQTIWCWGNAFNPYAAAYPPSTPATGVVSVAVGASGQARYLTTDGMLHIATAERSPDCGPLE